MKKVVCIDNKDYENDLIIGNIYYDVSSEYDHGEYIFIQNTYGYNNSTYIRKKELFLSLEEYRNKKIDKLLE